MELEHSLCASQAPPWRQTSPVTEERRSDKYQNRHLVGSVCLSFHAPITLSPPPPSLPPSLHLSLDARLQANGCSSNQNQRQHGQLMNEHMMKIAVHAS